MHLSHGNLDLLLPLTHAEHSLHSVQSDVAMKTLHLPAKKKRLRQSWISPCPPCRPDRQLGPDESSSAAGDAGQVFCPPDHGASSVFHSASWHFPSTEPPFSPMAICPRFDSAATAAETGPDARPSYYVVQFGPAHVPCQPDRGVSSTSIPTGTLTYTMT